MRTCVNLENRAHIIFNSLIILCLSLATVFLLHVDNYLVSVAFLSDAFLFGLLKECLRNERKREIKQSEWNE